MLSVGYHYNSSLIKSFNSLMSVEQVSKLSDCVIMNYDTKLIKFMKLTN